MNNLARISLITFIVIIASLHRTYSQPNAPQNVAGFPVNYDEAGVGTYTLPELLVTSNGKKVTDAKTWTDVRRPEIVKLYEEYQFGKMPGRPADLRFNVFDKGTPAYGGKAIRKQV